MHAWVQSYEALGEGAVHDTLGCCTDTSEGCPEIDTLLKGVRWAQLIDTPFWCYCDTPFLTVYWVKQFSQSEALQEGHIQLILAF